MEENSPTFISNAEIVGIGFCLSTPKEIFTASISGFPINHVSQLSNSYLGLPLEFGKCSACGTSEPGNCEGHFGFIELPVPIYHPSHISELKRLLSLLCLNCLKLKNKFQVKSGSVAERLLASCCENSPSVSINEVTKTDGACYLELKQPSRLMNISWKFLERYGFRYGDHHHTRTLLPCEVMEILKRIPVETRRKLSKKGFFSQEGYILQYLPVPPNCLSVPDISDGVSVMSSDLSTTMLKKILKQVEIIKSSRSGTPNFESHEVEANVMQSVVEQYLQVRGTVKASRNIDTRYGVTKDATESSTKAWLEKMRTLFIRKGSGFSSRSVITGDPYKKVNEIGIPSEIAQRITFEERVNMHNVRYLQNLVDKKLCLTFRDGSSTYSLREGSKGHTFLRPGQVVHRRIMDGDIVFINRPPTTHKHSLQALSVYVHDDHTVKINPLICGPLAADFDGDCIHLFYPQSLPAKAEVFELFSVEKQLLSSHTGNLNLQLATDSLLSLKVMLKNCLFKKANAQQLSMFLSSALPQPALLKGNCFSPCWTAFQLLQTAFPASLDCSSDRYLIRKSEILNFNCSRDLMQSVINEVVTSIFFENGPKEALNFFDSLQPFLMENIFGEGFSVSLEDFSIPKVVVQNIQKDIRDISPLLRQLRATYNELVALQIRGHIQIAKEPIVNFILKSSAFGDLIDSKSDSAVNKVVQQIGFLGLELSEKGKFYSSTLVEDVAQKYQRIYPTDGDDYPSAEFGLIKSCFFRGLDPYEGMVHSISTREVIVRSSRGLTEPGTLFKNLMAILRDVVICYDGTVRNISSSSIIQFQYGLNARTKPQFPAGEPVGVLAATAMSNPAYKAVLDSTPSSNSSWELMKEILVCKVSFKNDLIDRRVILYLKECDCGRKYCQENAAYLVKNRLRKVKLKDAALELIVEYKQQQTVTESEAGLVGQIVLDKELLKELNITLQEIHTKCLETISSFRKNKKTGNIFKRTDLFVSESYSIQQTCAKKWLDMPCLMFFCQVTTDDPLDSNLQDLVDIIYPVLLETVIKGDPRICSANIIWISPDTTTWIRSPSKNQKGELALDVVLEKSAVKQNGDAWRTVIDCCIPVINLIDTQRSIPYAIKQVQELLGISCTFEQAVQRLSTSVSMVTRGVLKEHLILLANSMTCAGTLIGFNSGGYKALSRSLNIQVPFTEATLFTPRRCFERAAEKCHVDSLSSVVASCSWGKRVAVGTGSHFDLLLDRKEVGFDQVRGIDVYNFLHMVGGGAGPSSTTGCLGEEVDNLMEVDNMEEWNLSPEHSTGIDKPMFEDDFQHDLHQPAESSWDKVVPSDNGSNWDGWSQKPETDDKFAAAALNTATKQTEWGNWGTAKSNSQDGTYANEQTDTQHRPAESSWEKVVSTDNGLSWNKKPNDVNKFAAAETEQIEWSNWGTGKLKMQNDAFPNEGTYLKEKDKLSGWGIKKSNGWDAGTSSETPRKESEKPDASDALPWSGWGTGDAKSGGLDLQKAAESAQGWGSKSLDESSKSGGWDLKKSVDSSQGWGSKTLDESSKSGGWELKLSVDSSQGWGSKALDESSKSGGWDLKLSGDSSQGWGSKTLDESSKSGGWDLQKSVESSQGWGEKTLDVSSTSGGWDLQKLAESSQGWGEKTLDVSSKSGGWDLQKLAESSQGWGEKTLDVSSKSGGWDLQQTVENSQGWGSRTLDDSSKSGGHDLQKSMESVQGWGSLNETNQPAGANGWDTQDVDNSQSEKSHPWSRGSRRWASDASKKNRPFKSAQLNDDSNMAGMLTVTRQRLDMFTSEEQDILLAIEPLMLSIRKIMHQSGYNDGDPLSAADQSFIIDNVFAHHPDKAVKMGIGIDYVMVNKHIHFPETKCFYVVSTDGQKQDFSYRKCLDNYVRVKYPDLADEFIGKYFRKPRSGGNRERERSVSVAPDNTEPEKH